MSTIISTEENITFLFTDIEHSTRLAQKLGEEYPNLLFQYRSLIRLVVSESDGKEIDNAGDGFFITFKDVNQAVCSAVRIPRRSPCSQIGQASGFKS